MSRIKDNQEEYINRQVQRRLEEAFVEKNVAVSFEYELSNHNYSVDGIKDKSEKLRFYEEFKTKIKIINCKTWKVFGMERKRTGYETLSFKQFAKGLQLSLKSVEIVSPDSKLDVIRVANEYRVIGKYLNGVYYILAYDIDFSAYAH